MCSLLSACFEVESFAHGRILSAASVQSICLHSLAFSVIHTVRLIITEFSRVNMLNQQLRKLSFTFGRMLCSYVAAGRIFSFYFIFLPYVAPGIESAVCIH